MKFSVGDTVYFVANSRFVCKATVIRYNGVFYTIKFEDTGGGTRVRVSKLFKNLDLIKRVTRWEWLCNQYEGMVYKINID